MLKFLPTKSLGLLAGLLIAPTIQLVHLVIIDEPPTQNTTAQCHALVPRDTWPDSCDA